MSADGAPEGEAVRIYRAYNTAENARDHDAMGQLLAADIAIEMNGRPALSSAEDDAVAMAALFDAYPDYHREIASVVDGGDTAAVRWRMVGHAAARFVGRLQDLDVHGCSVILVEGGRMTRAWLYSAGGQIDAVLTLAGTAPDRVLVLGPDPLEPSFVWCAGQGGFGIQASPSAARAVVSLLDHGVLPDDVMALGGDAAAVRPDRFRR